MESRTSITMESIVMSCPDIQKAAADNFEKMMKQKRPKTL
ncbi:hypothetical protein C2W64_04524 [Brevibacillus laterosporus]|nr:hypothetical protein C2W64_04524 [Brevibacillus laterosporus]